MSEDPPSILSYQPPEHRPKLRQWLQQNARVLIRYTIIAALAMFLCMAPYLETSVRCRTCALCGSAWTSTRSRVYYIPLPEQNTHSPSPLPADLVVFPPHQHLWLTTRSDRRVRSIYPGGTSAGSGTHSSPNFAGLAVDLLAISQKTDSLGPAERGQAWIDILTFRDTHAARTVLAAQPPSALEALRAIWGDPRWQRIVYQYGHSNVAADPDSLDWTAGPR